MYKGETASTQTSDTFLLDYCMPLALSLVFRSAPTVSLSSPLPSILFLVIGPRLLLHLTCALSILCRRVTETPPATGAQACAGGTSAQDREGLADGSSCCAEPDHGAEICIALYDLRGPVRVRDLMRLGGGGAFTGWETGGDGGSKVEGYKSILPREVLPSSSLDQTSAAVASSSSLDAKLRLAIGAMGTHLRGGGRAAWRGGEEEGSGEERKKKIPRGTPTMLAPCPLALRACARPSPSDGKSASTLDTPRAAGSRQAPC
eukprot:371592-Hanusia_phi.AAC.1